MRSAIPVLIVVAALFLSACTNGAPRKTYGGYSNWHAMQDRGGFR